MSISKNINDKNQQHAESIQVHCRSFDSELCIQQRCIDITLSVLLDLF